MISRSLWIHSPVHWAGSPVTATVEIAEAKGSAFGSAKLGSGADSGAREAKRSPSDSEAAPLTPSSRRASRSESRRSSRSGGKDGTANSSQAYGAMKEVPRLGAQVATGITPLVGGEATGDICGRLLLNGGFQLADWYYQRGPCHNRSSGFQLQQ